MRSLKLEVAVVSALNGWVAPGAGFVHEEDRRSLAEAEEKGDALPDELLALSTVTASGDAIGRKKKLRSAKKRPESFLLTTNAEGHKKLRGGARLQQTVVKVSTTEKAQHGTTFCDPAIGDCIGGGLHAVAWCCIPGPGDLGSGVRLSESKAPKEKTSEAKRTTASGEPGGEVTKASGEPGGELIATEDAAKVAKVFRKS
eukprot:g5102.t1